MQLSILLLLVIVICLCAFGYLTYHHEVQKRAHEKKRNQYHDRV